MESIHIEPEILQEEDSCMMEEQNMVRLRFRLPGVTEDSIRLHLFRDRLELIANANGQIEFHSSYRFSCCYAVPERARKSWNKGVLTIEVPTVCD